MQYYYLFIFLSMTSIHHAEATKLTLKDENNGEKISRQITALKVTLDSLSFTELNTPLPAASFKEQSQKENNNLFYTLSNKVWGVLTGKSNSSKDNYIPLAYQDIGEEALDVLKKLWIHELNKEKISTIDNDLKQYWHEDIKFIHYVKTYQIFSQITHPEKIEELREYYREGGSIYTLYIKQLEQAKLASNTKSTIVSKTEKKNQ